MELAVLLEDLYFPEGPRWHDGRLWFSDFYAHEVVAVDLEGRRETIVEVPNQPSGLGWDPRGRLLLVSMLDRRLLRCDGDRLEEVADLSGVATWHCNDMVVDEAGRAYVGNMGSDRHQGPLEPATLARVDPDGTVTPAADELVFPNGMVITPDGTLVVAETFANRLTAFDRAADGSLSGRRVWADLGPTVPDGICLDAEGAIWVADPLAHEVVRVREGGEVMGRVPTGDRGAFACALGGDDRRSLLICTALRSGAGAAEDRAGRIEWTRVDVPGAGLP